MTILCTQPISPWYAALRGFRKPAMTSATSALPKPDLSALSAAIARNTDGALGRFLESYRWTVLAEYVHPVSIRRGQILIAQGDSDRKLYFLESGDLQVDVKSDAGLVRVALLGPGSVVGEGSFFSHLARSATVVAYSDAKVWELSPKTLNCCPAASRCGAGTVHRARGRAGHALAGLE